MDASGSFWGIRIDSLGLDVFASRIYERAVKIDEAVLFEDSLKYCHEVALYWATEQFAQQVLLADSIQGGRVDKVLAETMWRTLRESSLPQTNESFRVTQVLPLQNTMTRGALVHARPFHDRSGALIAAMLGFDLPSPLSLWRGSSRQDMTRSLEQLFGYGVGVVAVDRTLSESHSARYASIPKIYFVERQTYSALSRAAMSAFGRISCEQLGSLFPKVARVNLSDLRLTIPLDCHELGGAPVPTSTLDEIARFLNFSGRRELLRALFA